MHAFTVFNLLHAMPCMAFANYYAVCTILRRPYHTILLPILAIYNIDMSNLFVFCLYFCDGTDGCNSSFRSSAAFLFLPVSYCNCVLCLTVLGKYIIHSFIHSTIETSPMLCLWIFLENIPPSLQCKTSSSKLMTDGRFYRTTFLVNMADAFRYIQA